MSRKSVGITFGVIVIVIVLFIILGMPAITGGIVKRQVEAWQRQIKFPGRNVTIQVSHYHRGWFHSTADIKISTKQPLGIESQLLGNKKGNGQPTKLTLDAKLEIAHGPFAHLSSPITGHSWSWGAGMAHAQITLLQPSPENYPNFPILQSSIYANILLKWDGSLVVWIKHPAGKIYKDPDFDGEVTTKGINGKFTISRNFDRLHSRIVVNDLQIVFGDNGSLQMGKVTHSLTMRLHKDGIWYGKSVVSIPVVRFIVKSTEAARLDKVVLTSGNERAKDNTLTVRDKFSINKISVVGRKFGSFNFDMSVEKLNPQAFVKFRDLYQKIQRHLATLPQNQQLVGKERQQLISQIQPVVSQFLQGVELRLNTLQLRTRSGQAQLTGMLKLPNTEPPHPKGEGSWGDLMALVQAAHGEAKFVVSQRLLDQVLSLSQLLPQMSDSLSALLGIPKETEKTGPGAQFNALLPPMLRGMQQQSKVKTALLEKGWLVPEGGHYVINVRYDKQKLTVNGHALQKLLPAREPEQQPKQSAQPGSSAIPTPYYGYQQPPMHYGVAPYHY